MRNSYQRLKEKNKHLEDEIKRLRSDINELVLRPNSLDSLIIKQTVMVSANIDDAIFKGNFDLIVRDFRGLMPQITDVRIVKKY